MHMDDRKSLIYADTRPSNGDSLWRNARNSAISWPIRASGDNQRGAVRQSDVEEREDKCNSKCPITQA